MAETYTGTVVFGTGKPYDAGWGPSINILVDMDDPNAPKTNDRGQVRVYKGTDDPVAGYMESLVKGDVVTLQLMDNGTKQWYNIVQPDEFDPSEPRVISKVQPEAQHNTTLAYEPESEQDDLIWTEMAEREALRLLTALSIVERLTEGTDTDPDSVRAMANSVFIRTNQRFRPGMLMRDTRDQQLIDQVDESDTVNTLLLAIARMHEHYESANEVADVLKKFYKSKDDVHGKDSWVELANIAWLYADLVEQGMDEPIAVTTVKDKFNIQPPAPAF